MSDQTPSLSLDQQSATLTTTLFSKLPKVLARALQLAAIPYWFDLPLLEALRGPDNADGRTPKIMDWLAERSFVSPLPGGRYVLAPDMRDLIRLRWLKDRAGFAEANRRLADYFAGRLAAERAAGLEADELTQARIYYLLAADGDAGIGELRQAFAAAEFYRRMAVVEKLVAVAQEQRSFLQVHQAAWIDYLAARALQLRNRWAESCDALQKLLERSSDLPTDLRPRVQAALAAGLIETEHWTRAIELYREALAAFERIGEFDEAAACQLGLGYAHMDLGLNVWGQRESRLIPTPSFRQTLVDVVTLPARLPVLLYVLFGARREASALLPAWLTLARGVDWTIARLFVQASQWYHLALSHVEAAGDADGILRAKDSLARLYLALGYPSGAAAMYREVIERPDIATSEYQMARARVGLGTSLLRLGQATEAARMLHAAAPVLVNYNDLAYAGHTFALLGEAQMAFGTTATGAASDAALGTTVASFSTALELLQAQGDVRRATDVAHHLEIIAARGDAPGPVRAQAGQLAASVVQRRYQTRYSHPALAVFQQVSVVALAVTLFFTLYLATRTETVVEVGAGTALIAQALAEPSSSPSPVIALSRTWQITPQFRPNVAMGGLLFALIGYLVAYSAIGLYVLTRTSLRRLEERPSQSVQLDAEALSSGPHRIAWAEATGVLRNDWTLWKRNPVETARRAVSETASRVASETTHRVVSTTLPLMPDVALLPTHSQTVLFGPNDRRITVTGRTAWYPALSQEIERRVPPSALYPTPRRADVSTHLLNSPAGILLIGNAIYLALFVALGYLASDWLSRPILFGYYALADLRVLIYLALLVPLVAWLVIAPMRARVFLNPRSRMPWVVAGIGLGLACVSFINLGRLRFSLGRPDVLVSLLAVWLVWLGALTIWNVRSRVLEPGSAPAYPAPVRWGGLIVAVVIAAMAAPLVYRELVSYDALVAGNAARDRAIRLAAQQNAPEASANYAKAVTAYNQALQYNPRDVTAHTGLGAIYGQFNEWDRAISNTLTSLAINPRQPAVWSNLGLTYEGKANALDDRLATETDPGVRRALGQQEQEAFRSALNAYTRAVELDRSSPKHALRRGVVYCALGQLLLQDGKQDEARNAYLAAEKDFELALRLDPKNADAYNGIGWVHLKLGEMADAAQRQSEYEAARENFSRAVQLDPANANAYNGLAWVWLKLGSLQLRQGNNDAAQLGYEKAVEAYMRASQLAPDDPQYAVSLGNARWLVSTNLATCKNPSATDAELTRYVDLIQAAIADLERGVKMARAKNIPLEKSAAALGTTHYYRQLGQLAFILVSCRGQDVIARLEQSIAYYDQALAIEPSNADYLQMRGRITYKLGAEQPSTPEGQQRRIQAYQRALSDLSTSLAIAPDNHDSLWWRAVVGIALGQALPQDVDGLAQRQGYMMAAVADRLAMLALSKDPATRADDARLVASAYLNLGWTCYLRGNYRQAVSEAENGLKYDATNPSLYFNKGLAELAQGDEQAARRAYDSGVVAARQLSDDLRGAKLKEAMGDLQNLASQRPDLERAAAPILKSLQVAEP